MSMDSDSDYEDDYEDEFEAGDLPGTQSAGADGRGSPPIDSKCGGEQAVSLEEYMQQLEDAPGGDDDEDGNDIMSSITRGLDGLSPPPSAQAGHASSPHEDSDDAILKKFNIQLSPRPEKCKVAVARGLDAV